LGEFGIYQITPNFDGGPKCNFAQISEPVNANLAILYTFLIVAALCAAYKWVFPDMIDGKKWLQFRL